MKCSECHRDSDGRFCAHCGAALAGARCGACDSPLPTGAHFCTRCGRAVRPRTSAFPWIVTGLALAATILVILWPAIQQRRALRDAAATPQLAQGNPPPLTGTPREQADRLFNRVMEERANGNTEQATFFATMATQAYQQAEPLDNDGLFHLSLLQSATGEGRAAIQTAERVLAQEPDHLLALAAAAEGAIAVNDSTAAARYYQRFLQAYETQRDRQLPEYVDHALVLPEYKAAAERFPAR